MDNEECEMECDSDSSDEDYNENFSFDPNSNSDWQIFDNNKKQNTNAFDDELLIEDVDCNNPLALFKIFYTDTIMELIVRETNRYAEQCNAAEENKYKKKHHKSWTPLTEMELNIFFGILLIMSLVRMPNMASYWSVNDMYTNLRIKKAMSRERFLLIYKYIRFADSSQDSKDELYEIREVLENFLYTLRNAIYPGQNLVIVETAIPFKGRLPIYRNKKGMKINKLCLPGGYTHNMILYTGKKTKSTKVEQTFEMILNLTNNLLHEERIIFTDSNYSSIPLAEELLVRKTYLCGDVNVNRQYLPTAAKQMQKPGELIRLKNGKGIKFLKWTNKHSVSLITTCPHHNCDIMQTEDENTSKPDALLDYYKAKRGCVGSVEKDGISKSSRWYCKIIFHLICNVAITNAFYINQKWGTDKFEFLKFKEYIIDNLISRIGIVHTQMGTHVLARYPPGKSNRRRCKECYRFLKDTQGSKVASSVTKRVYTYCNNCEDKPTLCLKCFLKLHTPT